MEDLRPMMLQTYLDKMVDERGKRLQQSKPLPKIVECRVKNLFEDNNNITLDCALIPKEENEEDKNSLATSSRPLQGVHFFPRQEQISSSGNSNHCSSDELDFDSPLATRRANDIPLTGAFRGSEDPFTLERFSRSAEGLSGHPPRRGIRSPSKRSRTEWDDRSPEDLSRLRHRRSRSPSGRSSAEWDDREVPNPESERDSEESLGEGSEEETRVFLPPGMVAAALACNYDAKNHFDWTRLRGSFSGGIGSTMGQETLGTTALPRPPPSVPAAALSMNGPSSLYPASVLAGMPGVPVPASPFVDGQQSPPFGSEVIARVLAAAHGPRKPRGEKKPIPDEQKDTRYYERRKKNNEAAKKSRDARKMREDETAKHAEMLEKENAYLRREISILRTQFSSANYDEDTSDIFDKIKCLEEVLKIFRKARGV